MSNIFPKTLDPLKKKNYSTYKDIFFSVVLKQLGNMTQIKKGQYYMHYKPNKLNTEDKECLRLKSVDKHTTHLNFSLQNITQLPNDPSKEFVSFQNSPSSSSFC